MVFLFYIIEDIRFILDKIASGILTFIIAAGVIYFVYLGNYLKSVIANVPIDLKMRKDKLREISITSWLCVVILVFRVLISIFTWKILPFVLIYNYIEFKICIYFIIYIICNM